MYSPPHYRESRDDLMFRLIEDYGFATLLGGDVGMSGGGYDLISHIPMMLERQAGPMLLGHMARANPHWRCLLAAGRAKALFHGPHAYVSPAWYQPKEDNVPTWNYAVVHVEGRFETIEDPAEAFACMERMVRRFETGNGTGWVLPRDSAGVDRLMKGIVVFRLQDLNFEGKFKLSQNQPAINRDNVIRNFADQEHPELKRLAEYMTATTQPRPQES